MPELYSDEIYQDRNQSSQAKQKCYFLIAKVTKIRDDFIKTRGTCEK